MKKVLLRSLVLLAALALLASASGLAQEGTEGVLGSTDTINFQGRLVGSDGAPLNGNYNLRFSVYSAPTAGSVVWGPETHNGVPVSNGLFTVQLGSSVALGDAVFEGSDRWLQVDVHNTAMWETLAPRLMFSSTAYAMNADKLDGLDAADLSEKDHSHWGHGWSGTGAPLGLENTGNGNALLLKSKGGTGLYVESAGKDGVMVGNATNDGINIVKAGTGIYVDDVQAMGLWVRVARQHGVYVDHADDSGVWVAAANNYGVHAQGGTDDSGDYGGHFEGYNGVYGQASVGVGGRFGSTTGNILEGYGSQGALAFKVDNSGNVYADGTYSSPAADFAEMLPGVEGLEPGDVVAVGPDGTVCLASADDPQALVGVYSTEPAFVGGSGAQGPDAQTANIPVAIMGIVPVKVSAENGPIRPNDSLTVSSIPGYAAKAEPLFVLDGGEAVYAGGEILGRALEGLDSGQGVIQVIIQLR